MFEFNISVTVFLLKIKKKKKRRYNTSHTIVSTVKRDCEVTPWSDWGPCSPTCGVGVSQRTRAVTFLPVNGGKECPPLLENKGCFRQLCGGRELGEYLIVF